jgi:Family of unknown function (DUF5985)
MAAALVYVLGALTTLLCCVLLLRAYFHVRQRLLFWSGLCFAGLTLSNTLLFVDLVLVPESVSLHLWRLATAASAMVLMLYGLIREGK